MKGEPSILLTHQSVLYHHRPIAPVVDDIHRLASRETFFIDPSPLVVEIDVTVLLCEVAVRRETRSGGEQIAAFGCHDPRKASAVVIDIIGDYILGGTSVAQLPVFIDRAVLLIRISYDDGAVFVRRACAGEFIGGIVTVCRQRTIVGIDTQAKNRRCGVTHIGSLHGTGVRLVFRTGFMCAQYPIQCRRFVFGADISVRIGRQIVFGFIKFLLIGKCCIVAFPMVGIQCIREVLQLLAVQSVVDERLYNISPSVAAGVNLYVLRCISQSVVIADIISDLLLLGVSVVVVVESSCQNPVTIVIEREHVGVVADALQFGRIALTAFGVGSDNAIVARCSRSRQT